MSFLKAFQTVQNQCSSSFKLIGDNILVEEVRPTEQLTKGGIFIPQTEIKQIDGIEANRPTFVRALLVGCGFYDPGTEQEVKLDVEPGDILLVGRLSVKWLSTFGPIVASKEAQIGLVRESEIQLQFNGATGQDEVFATLRRELGFDV